MEKYPLLSNSRPCPLRPRPRVPVRRGQFTAQTEPPGRPRGGPGRSRSPARHRGAWRGVIGLTCSPDATFFERLVPESPGVGFPHEKKRKKSQGSGTSRCRRGGSRCLSRRPSRAASPRARGPRAGMRPTRRSPPLGSPSPTG